MDRVLVQPKLKGPLPLPPVELRGAVYRPARPLRRARQGQWDLIFQCRRIDLPCTVDFMAVSSYGSGTSSTGQVQITKDLSSDIAGKHIIVVEDILDSGNTLSYLLKLLAQRKPASIRLCTLLDKPERRTKPVEVHYSGFTIPDAFVVGYGLDYAEHYRNLPYIGILKPEVYGG